MKHGTKNGYRQGCRCDECTAAQAEHQRDYLQRKKAGQIGDASVTPLFTGGAAKGVAAEPVSAEPEAEYQIGPVEMGVIEECRNFPQAQARPAMVEQARALARLLDDERRVALWPTTSRQLTTILNDLRDSAKRKARGRLASVQKMTRQDQQSATGT